VVTDDPSHRSHCGINHASTAARLLLNGRLETDVYWRSLPSRLESLLIFVSSLFSFRCFFSYFDELMNKLISSATLPSAVNQFSILNVFCVMNMVFSSLRRLEKSLITILQVVCFLFILLFCFGVCLGSLSFLDFSVSSWS
jgi:hypothetical protein